MTQNNNLYFLTKKSSVVLNAIAIILLSSCSDQAPNKTEATPQPKNHSITQKTLDKKPANKFFLIDETLANTKIDRLFEQNMATLSASLKTFLTLQIAVNKLLDNPSSSSLENAQRSWRDARNSYQHYVDFDFTQTSLPQSIKDQLGYLRTSHFHISAYPIEPGFLDSFGVYAYSGIVHNISLELTENELININAATTDEEISLGLYAIEYMLFGLEKNRTAQDFTAVTSLSDDLHKRGFKDVNETPQARRRKILSLQIDILNKNIIYIATNTNQKLHDSIFNNAQHNGKNARLIWEATVSRYLTYALTAVVKQNELFANQSQQKTSETSQHPTDSTLTRHTSAMFSITADLISQANSSLSALAHELMRLNDLNKMSQPEWHRHATSSLLKIKTALREPQ